MKITFSLLAIIFFIFPGLALAQSNSSEILTISTYYPSPYGVYRNLEAKKALSVGNFTGAPSGLTNVQDLQNGQLYVGYSEIFKGLSSDPAGKTGQVIYNSNQKMLKFFDGSKWINASCTSPLCGSSNGKNLRLTPAAGTLCAVGTASAITGSGPWYWQCTDGAATSCFANLTADGVCGGAAIAHPNSATTWIGPYCSVGTANPIWTAFPAAGSSASWTCLGLNGGTNRPCSGSHDIGTTPPAAPACGSSDGQTLSAAPAANLCSSGTASAVSGSGPWNWTCTGSTSVSCSANLATTAPACGLSNGQTFSAAPAANLCSSGIASAVSGSGPWNWTCTSSTSVSCSADLAAAAPACGSSNGQTLSAAPTADLCSSGTASAVSGSGPWNWTCTSSDGKTSVSCSADLAAPAVNGICGPAATTYAYSAAAYSGAFCSAGNANPAAPAFPAAGRSATWSCTGSNGGTSPTCTASHAGPTCTSWTQALYSYSCDGSGGIRCLSTGYGEQTLFIPSTPISATLTYVAFDDSGRITVNGNIVFDNWDTNPVSCLKKASPNANIVSNLHAGSNTIGAIVNNNCDLSMSAVVTINYCY